MPICYDDDSFYDFLSTGDGSHVSRKILMDGDSWISHPQVHNLSRAMDYDGEGDYGILNLGNPGTTAHEMFHKASGSLRRLHRVVKTLRYGYEFDLIFFSAGGNDIIGPEIRGFLLDKRQHPGSHGADLIDTGSYNRGLRHIVADYRKILRVISRSTANRRTPVIAHTYSNLKPRKVGTHLGAIKFNRGWVARYMDEDKHISDEDEQQEIIKTLLTRFRDAMQQLENDFPRFLLVDTLRTLSTGGKPDVSLFHDEIHPNLRGFRKVFRRIKRVARDRKMWL